MWTVATVPLWHSIILLCFIKGAKNKLWWSSCKRGGPPRVESCIPGLLSLPICFHIFHLMCECSMHGIVFLWDKNASTKRIENSQSSRSSKQSNTGLSRPQYTPYPTWRIGTSSTQKYRKKRGYLKVYRRVICNLSKWTFAQCLTTFCRWHFGLTTLEDEHSPPTYSCKLAYRQSRIWISMWLYPLLCKI